MPTQHEREKEALDLLSAAFDERRYGRIAAVSSFGAESAVLLHLVSRIDRAAPVIFIDTGMLFQETLEYKRELVDFLGLTNVGTIAPSARTIRTDDPWGRLHKNDPDRCCDLRKTRPLEEALQAFDGWITGRKRHQAVTRADLPMVEHTASGKVKLNPLAGFDAGTVETYLRRFDLPQHPLVENGYPSIGCASCTSRVAHGEDQRAGRWRGMDKVECGIHFENGRIVRGGAALPSS